VVRVLFFRDFLRPSSVLDPPGFCPPLGTTPYGSCFWKPGDQGIAVDVPDEPQGPGVNNTGNKHHENGAILASSDLVAALSGSPARASSLFYLLDPVGMKETL
jgi:hypothetical protein